MRNNRNVVYILLALIVVQCVVYYPILPDILASHFDWRGIPNGWQSKPWFFITYLSMVILVYLIHVLGPWLVKHKRYRLVNIPNKDYWFSPERAEKSTATISAMLSRLSAVSLLFILSLIQFVIIANLQPDIVLPSTWTGPLVGIFFVYLLLWIARILWRFRRRY